MSKGQESMPRFLDPTRDHQPPPTAATPAPLTTPFPARRAASLCRYPPRRHRCPGASRPARRCAASIWISIWRCRRLLHQVARPARTTMWRSCWRAHLVSCGPHPPLRHGRTRLPSMRGLRVDLRPFTPTRLGMGGWPASRVLAEEMKTRRIHLARRMGGSRPMGLRHGCRSRRVGQAARLWPMKPSRRPSRHAPPAWLKNLCCRCLEPRHRAAGCRNPIICRRCFRSGHRVNDCTNPPAPHLRLGAKPGRPQQLPARPQAASPPRPRVQEERPSTPPPPGCMAWSGDHLERTAEVTTVIHSTSAML